MKIQKYQQGGMAPAPAPEGAPVDPAMGGGQDPLMQILQIAGEALQSGNCEAAMAVCEALLMLAQGGGGAAPVGAPQGEPVFKKGGKMCKRGGEINIRPEDFKGKAQIKNKSVAVKSVVKKK